MVARNQRQEEWSRDYQSCTQFGRLNGFNILQITGSGGGSSQETAFRNALIAAGASVTQTQHTPGNFAANISGKHLYIVHSTISGAIFLDSGIDTPVPGLLLSPFILADNLLSSSEGTNTNDMTILASEHPLTHGLSGTVQIVTSPGTGQGNTIAGGRRLGQMATNQIGLAYWVQGDARTSGVVPARRCFFGAPTTVDSGLTAAGQGILRACVNWTLGLI